MSAEEIKQKYDELLLKQTNLNAEVSKAFALLTQMNNDLRNEKEKVKRLADDNTSLRLQLLNHNLSPHV